MERFGNMLDEMGVENFIGKADRSKFGLEDATVSNQVNVGDWVRVKEKSMQHHRTQLNPDNFFNKLPKEWIDNFRTTEYFALVAGAPLPDTEDARTDLFAGLR